LIQVPETIDAANNITKVGFAIHTFSIGERKDIDFSDQQEDALGDQHKAAKILFYLFISFMCLALIIPLLMGAVHRWGSSKMDGKLVMSKIAKSFATVSIPVLVVFTILMAIPFVLLARSNLCGPNYVELRFQGIDGDSEDVEGTIAFVHEDIGASCELGSSGFDTAFELGIWPFILLIQAFFLNRKANKLRADFENAKNRTDVATSVIEVNDEHNHEDDNDVEVNDEHNHEDEDDVEVNVKHNHEEDEDDVEVNDEHNHEEDVDATVDAVSLEMDEML
jgi:hypothetical protein